MREIIDEASPSREEMIIVLMSVREVLSDSREERKTSLSLVLPAQESDRKVDEAKVKEREEMKKQIQSPGWRQAVSTILVPHTDLRETQGNMA